MPSPEDLPDGGHLGILARDVRELCSDMKDVKKELGEVGKKVAYIEGQLKAGSTLSSNSTKLKATITGSIIMALSGIIVAIIALFKPV